MATRQHKNTSQYSPLPLPLEGTEQVEVWRNGVQYQTTLDVLGGNPGPHGESHESGGDRIGTQTPTADAIVRGDDDGLIDDWVSDATTTKKGKAQFAAHNEKAANKMMQADDPRNENPRPPTAHAASHLGGPDGLGLGSAALLDVGVADGVCPLNSAGEVSESFIRNADNTQSAINGATAKATPVDADVFGFLDSVASFVIKKCTWANIKAVLKTYFDTLYSTLVLGTSSTTAHRGDHGSTAYTHSQSTHAPSNADNTQSAINAASAKTTPVDADVVGILDSAASNAIKKLSWANIKATLKAYFDTVYGASSLTLGATSTTAHRGDHGSAAYTHSQSTHAPTNADNTQTAINGASTKATPVNADVVGILDSAASNAIKKLSWGSLKTALGDVFVPKTGSQITGSITVEGQIIPTAVPLSGSVTIAKGAEWTPPRGFLSLNYDPAYVFGGTRGSTVVDWSMSGFGGPASGAAPSTFKNSTDNDVPTTWYFLYY